MDKIPCDPQIGADVEGFLYNKKTSKFVPCVGVLPGTKDDPAPIPGLSKGYYVQEDNVMAEWNIPPVKTPKGFHDVVKRAKAGVAKMLPEYHTIRYRPFINFLPKDLTSQQAQQFGCDPDFDAYLGGVQRTPLDPEGVLWRGAGGHIHLGGNFQCPDFVAGLFADIMIGVMCDLRPNSKDKRGTFYGQPGIFRPKPYGIEYRTPNSTWVNDLDKVYDVGRHALRLSKFLSDNDARRIQKVFRAFTRWDAVRAYMRSEKDGPDQNSIIQSAVMAGLPI